MIKRCGKQNIEIVTEIVIAYLLPFRLSLGITGVPHFLKVHITSLHFY